MIEFLCPNGHKIRCHPTQGGRGAKCPRCGVKFRVPEASEVPVTEAVGSDSNITPPDFTDSGIGSKDPAAAVESATERQIEFLCPNGHHLHGPASLQGRAGECPDCGSRFRIPVFDERDDVDLGDSKSDSKNAAATAAREDEKSAARSGADDDVPASLPTAATDEARHPAIPSVGGGPALASLFAKLWAQRSKGTSLEIRLRDGEKLVPDDFLKKHSGASHGVFAVREADGRLSLAVVSWEAIARVTLSGFKELPGDFVR